MTTICLAKRSIDLFSGQRITGIIFKPGTGNQEPVTRNRKLYI